MGNSSGSISRTNDEKKINNDENYPLTYNSTSPQNANVLIVYDNVTALYATNIINSLGALPLVNDYTIILHNIKTTIANKFSRFTKIERVYDEQLNKSDDSTTATTTTTDVGINDTNEKTSTAPPDDGQTKIVNGVVTIYSTVYNNVVKAEDLLTLLLKFSPSDTELVPSILVQVTDTEQKNAYHDGQLSSNWLKVSEPSNSTTTTKVSTKLFVQDETLRDALVFKNLRLAVNSSYNESFKYIVACDSTDFAIVKPHLNTIAQRNGIYGIYTAKPRSQFFARGFEIFANYFVSLTSKNYKQQYNYILFNFTKFASGMPVYQNRSVDMAATDPKIFKGDINFYQGKFYPKNLSIGYQYSTPFTKTAKDVVFQLFESRNLTTSTSSYFEYYHGTISMLQADEISRNNDEAYVLGAVLNMRMNISKKFTFYVSPPITDVNTLEYINSHKFLSYKNGYLTNIKNFADNVNIFEDGSSYLTINTSGKELKDNDLALDKEKLVSLRDDLKPITNPLFQTYPKSVEKGYFIDKPTLILSKDLRQKNFVYVYFSKLASNSAFWNFARLTTKLYKIDQDPNLSISNWIYLIKNSGISDFPGFKRIKLANGYQAVYPEALTTWNGSSISIDTLDNGLRIKIGNTVPRYIFFDKVPTAYEASSEVLAVSDAKSSPGRNWTQDKVSSFWTFSKPSYNMSQISENVVGGPINPLIYSFSTDILDTPQILQTSTLKESVLRTISIIRNISANLAPSYIKLFEDFFKVNASSLTTAIFMGINKDLFTEQIKASLVYGKYYEDNVRNVVVMYYIPKVMTFDNGTRTLSSKDFASLTFDTKRARETVVSDDLESGKLFLDDFINSSDRIDFKESMNVGPVTSISFYNKPFVTYNGPGLAIIYSDLVSMYSDRRAVSGQVRGVSNYITCTAINESYSKFWTIVKSMKDSDKLKLGEFSGDFMLLAKCLENSYDFEFPALQAYMAKYLEGFANDVKTTASGHLVVSSTATVVYGNKINVLDVDIEITNSSSTSSAMVTYNTLLSQWVTQNPGFSFSVLGFDSDTRLNQLNVNNPKVNISVSTIMTDITPVISFIVLRNASNDELRYLSNLYTQFPQMKHLLIIVLADVDLKPVLPNVTFVENHLIMYNSGIFSVISQTRNFGADNKYTYFRVTSNETNTFMKFGIFPKKYGVVEKATLLPDLDFAINVSTGTDYGSLVHIDSNDRVSITNNLYAFRNIDAFQAPVFHKFNKEINKYVMFLRPIPKQSLNLAKSGNKFIVMVTISSSKLTSYNVFEAITVIQQIKLEHSSNIKGFIIYTKPKPNIPSQPQTFSISDIVYSSNDLQSIGPNVYAYPEITSDKIQIPYYYMDNSVPLYYQKNQYPDSLPANAKALIYVDERANDLKLFRGSVFETIEFNVSNLTYRMQFVETNSRV